MTGLKRTQKTILALCLLGPVVGFAQSQSTTSAQDSANKQSWLAVAPGRVEPLSGEIRIGSPVAGQVGDVMIKASDKVFAGEALFRIDDDEVRIRHAKATVQVSLHKRARTAAKEGKAADRRKLEDAAADAERAVAQARAAVDQAATARRAGNGADAALAKARTALSEAQQRMQQRRTELAKFDLDSPTASSDLDSQMMMARLDLRAAQAALDNLTIRSPIDGTVLQVNVRTGELASPSATQPLVVVGDISALRVRAEVDERDFGAIRIGHAVVVRSTAFRGREIAGKVLSIAPIIEPGRIGARGQRTATDVSVAEVVIDLAEPGPLAVGMKVDVYFSRDSAQR